MKTIHINESFSCTSCKKEVFPAQGTPRNHCPFCLTSLHVDLNIPGDRLSTCHGIMFASRIIHHKKKGQQIEFVCRTCGHTHMNKAAPDDDQKLLQELLFKTNTLLFEKQQNNFTKKPRKRLI